MSNAAKRSIFRWIHIVLGIPIIGYIYSPFDQIPNYAPATRFVFVPVVVLSGLWMWKGHVVRRLFSKGLPQPDAAQKRLPPLCRSYAAEIAAEIGAVHNKTRSFALKPGPHQRQ
jgi:hypothetical protein